MTHRLLDGMKYTPAAATDIRELFDRIAPGWNRKPKRAKPRKLPPNVTQLRKMKV